MHRNPKTMTTLLVQVQKFYYLLDFQVFDTRRERHNFYYADCSSSVSSQLTDPTNVLAPHSKQLDSSTSTSQLTVFFKITKNPSPSLPGMTSFASPVSFPIRGFYYDICDCHIPPCEREHLRSMCAPTRALSRKVLNYGFVRFCFVLLFND